MRAAALLLLLAACSGDDARYNDTALSAKDAAAENAIETSVAQNGIGPAVAAGAPITAPSLGVARDRSLPTAFQGYWGLTPGDCELANVNATGRLAIENDRLRFYESSATVRRIERADANALTAAFAFSGEGERWTKRVTLSLTAGGTRLVRAEDGAQPITYQRC